MDDEQKANLLDIYSRKTEFAERVSVWLLFICIALIITCAIFFQNWQKEKTFRSLTQAYMEYYSEQADHYFQEYLKALSRR